MIQSYLSKGSESRETLLASQKDHTIAAASITSPQKKINEDRFLYGVFPNGEIVIAVADGVGASRCPELAATTALEQLYKSIKDGPVDEGAIIRGIDRANVEIQSLLPGSATTLTVVLISNGKYRYYSVGDSPAMLVGGHGKIKSLSKGHSAYDHFRESGVLLPPGVGKDVLKSELVSCLGSKDFVLEVGMSLPLNPKDSIVVCSDGFFDNIQLEHINPLYYRNRKFEKHDIIRIEKLYIKGMEKEDGHVDDATFISLRMIDVKTK